MQARALEVVVWLGAEPCPRPLPSVLCGRPVQPLRALQSRRKGSACAPLLATLLVSLADPSTRDRPRPGRAEQSEALLIGTRSRARRPHPRPISPTRHTRWSRSWTSGWVRRLLPFSAEEIDE